MLEHCLTKYSRVYHNIERSSEILIEALTKGGNTIYTNKDGVVMHLTWIDAWIDFTKTLYDFSLFFKKCYSQSEHNFYVFWLFITHYETLQNYLINMLPNSLAYAVYYAQWSNKIEELEGKPGRELELYFVYAVITRKLFLYDYIPD